MLLAHSIPHFEAAPRRRCRDTDNRLVSGGSSSIRNICGVDITQIDDAMTPEATALAQSNVSNPALFNRARLQQCAAATTTTVNNDAAGTGDISVASSQHSIREVRHVRRSAPDLCRIAAFSHRMRNASVDAGIGARKRGVGNTAVADVASRASAAACAFASGSVAL